MAQPTITVTKDAHSHMNALSVTYTATNGADNSTVTGTVVLSIDDRAKLKVYLYRQQFVYLPILLDIAQQRPAWLPSRAVQATPTGANSIDWQMADGLPDPPPS